MKFINHSNETNNYILFIDLGYYWASTCQSLCIADKKEKKKKEAGEKKRSSTEMEFHKTTLFMIEKRYNLLQRHKLLFDYDHFTV